MSEKKVKVNRRIAKKESKKAILLFIAEIKKQKLKERLWWAWNILKG